MRAKTDGNSLSLTVGEASQCKARTEVLPADAAGNAAGCDAGDARVCAPSGFLQHGGEDLMQLFFFLGSTFNRSDLPETALGQSP